MNGGWQLPDGKIATEFATNESVTLHTDKVFIGTIDYENTKMIWVAPTTEEGKANHERKMRWAIIDSQAEEEHVWPYENRGRRF